jgi:site-specific DNA-methyltransferase (adenine-specific)
MSKPLKNFLNQVICGDCLEVMKDIPSESIDMILCDLPYGTTACKWDTIIPFEPLWEQYKRIIKDNGAIVLTASQPFTSALVMSNIKMFKYEWIWNKCNPTNFASANKQPLKYHENVLVFSNKQSVYNPQKYQGKINHKQGNSKKNFAETRGNIKRTDDDLSGIKFPKSIIEFSKHSSQCGLHPTQKPVALFEYLIKTYTNEGDLVLDNCAGSGTTGVACINLNRNYILIDIEPTYCDIAKQRIKNLPIKLL